MFSCESPAGPRAAPAVPGCGQCWGQQPSPPNRDLISCFLSSSVPSPAKSFPVRNGSCCSESKIMESLSSSDIKLHMAGGWKGRIFEVPSNPNHPVFPEVLRDGTCPLCSCWITSFPMDFPLLVPGEEFAKGLVQDTVASVQPRLWDQENENPLSLWELTFVSHSA